MASPGHIFPQGEDKGKEAQALTELVTKIKTGDAEAIAELEKKLKQLAVIQTELEKTQKACQESTELSESALSTAESKQAEIEQLKLDKEEAERQARIEMASRLQAVTEKFSTETDSYRKEAQEAERELKRMREEKTLRTSPDSGLTAALIKSLVHKPPKFKGKVEEEPEVHILKVEDWFIVTDLMESQKVPEFCKTLEGEARLWYETQSGSGLGWRELRAKFLSRFTTGGDSSRSWLTKWANLSFNPLQDDIHKWVYNVQKIAKRCNYGDTAIVERIKFHMPPEMEAALLGIDELPEVTKKVIEYFSGKAATKQLYPLPPQFFGRTCEQERIPHSQGKVTDTSAPLEHLFQDFLDKSAHTHNVPCATQGTPGDSGHDFQEFLETYNAFQQNQSGDRDRPSKPWKPYITQGRGRPSFRGNSYRGRGYSQPHRGNFRGNFQRGRSFSQTRRGGWQTNYTQRSAGQREPPTCWNCEKKGHMSFECRSQPSQSRSQSRDRSQSRNRFQGRSRSPSFDRSRSRTRPGQSHQSGQNRPERQPQNNARVENEEDRNGERDGHEAMTERGHFPGEFNSVGDLN